MEENKEKVVSATVARNPGGGLKKVWTKCSNGHIHNYDCGVVVDPIPGTAACCGANVIDSGSDACGEG